MATSQWPAVVTNLVTVLDAQLSVDVYDTAQPGGDTGLCVVVGAPSDADDLSGQIRQSYATTGVAATREETGQVQCVILASSGDDDMPTLRAAAFDVLADIETVLRAHTITAGGQLLRTELVDARISQGLSADGAFVDLGFTIQYQALI